MRKILVYLTTLFFLSNSLFAYSSNPKDLINELVNDAILKLSDKNLNEEQKLLLLKK